MPDAFETLAALEERVKKAEMRIPALEAELLAAKQELVAQSGKMAKYFVLETALKEVLGNPSASTGAIRSQDIEVKDPSQIIEVQDFQEPLQVSTISLRGQVAKLIHEGKLGASLVNAKAVRHTLIVEFGPGGEQWDIDTVLKELKALTAPPFRLFTFNPKNYMFRLRTGSEKRVKE